MKRKTLAEMTAPEVVQHYQDLIGKRYDKAGALITSACKLPRDDAGARVLIAEANRLSKRAHALAKPVQFWHLDAAKEKLKRYNMKVAAGFMAANGWRKEAAYWHLFGKQYPHG